MSQIDMICIHWNHECFFSLYKERHFLIVTQTEVAERPILNVWLIPPRPLIPSLFLMSSLAPGHFWGLPPAFLCAEDLISGCPEPTLRSLQIWAALWSWQALVSVWNFHNASLSSSFSGRTTGCTESAPEWKIQMLLSWRATNWLA